MRIGVIADWLNPTMEQLMQILTERGAVIQLIFPEKQLTDLSTLRVENDLYLIKSGTEPALSVAGSLHMQGAATLNPYPTVAMLRNKVIVMRALQAAGVPVPDTFMTNSVADLTPLLETGPLILKPYRGTRGRGVRVIRTPDDLTDLPEDDLLLAQRYHAPDDAHGRDHKIFRIGQRLFGIRRVWPIQTYEDKRGESFEPTPDLQEIAVLCGKAFGIDLYGLDIVISQGKPYVVDLNKFGSYMGVPNATQLLADHIEGAARRVMNGEPLVTTSGSSDIPN